MENNGKKKENLSGKYEDKEVTIIGNNDVNKKERMPNKIPAPSILSEENYRLALANKVYHGRYLETCTSLKESPEQFFRFDCENEASAGYLRAALLSYSRRNGLKWTLRVVGKNSLLVNKKEI